MMKKILIPIPANDFDPTEAAIPWKILSENGINITFATPGLRAKRTLRQLGLKAIFVLYTSL